MKIPRFYQQQHFTIGQNYELSEVNHKHAIQVLRLKENDPLVLFNGEGGEFEARVVDASKRHSRIIIDTFKPDDNESTLKITLVLSMIKPDKMDFALQKAVELGVFSILPAYTERSVIKIKASRIDKKLQHWQAVITGACEQSGRTVVPTIAEPQPLSHWLESKLTKNGVVMLPGTQTHFMELPNTLEKGSKDSNITLLVGPEGGFTEDEEKNMRAANVTPVSFGPRILRAETAVIAGITACQLRWGDL